MADASLFHTIKVNANNQPYTIPVIRDVLYKAVHLLCCVGDYIRDI